MSHRHRGDAPPPSIDPTPIMDAAHHVSATIPINALDELDPFYMDAVLDYLTSEKDCAHYVAQAMELAKRSTVWGEVEGKILSAKSNIREKLQAMWALGLLTGASCAVIAVDEGLIVDSSGDEGGESGGSGYEGPED